MKNAEPRPAEYSVHPVKKLVPLQWTIQIRRLRLILRAPVPYLMRKFALYLSPRPRVEKTKRITRRRGFGWVSIEEFPFGKALMDEGSQIIGRKKQDFQPTLSVSKNVLLSADEFSNNETLMNFALSDPMLTYVGRYLGEAPVFYGGTLWWGKRGALQDGWFHLDSLDAQIIRLYIYFSDVELGSGPLCLLSARDTQRFCRRTHFRSGHPEDDVVFSVIDRRRLIEIVGPRGTAFAVDACRCLHYGSRMLDSDRLAMVITYGPYHNRDSLAATCRSIKPVPEESRLRRLARQHFLYPATDDPSAAKVTAV